MESTIRVKGGPPKFFLVGGGIASLAAAAFLIRDGDVYGQNITILEELSELGGSLDAAGSAEHGYVMRGGRMIESKYLCTYDLFSSIPTLDGGKSVTREIFDVNETLPTGSKSRIFRAGSRVDKPAFGLGERHILALEALAIKPESLLGTTSISDQFDATFFKSDFWLMWCTTFAFQPWHSAVEFKRYLLRFSHMVAGFNSLHGIMRTVYNQYDSLVRPLRAWLVQRDVHFAFDTRVTDLALTETPGQTRVARIVYEQNGKAGAYAVGPGDFVCVTLGSMTEASSHGTMDRAPVRRSNADGGAWRLWETIAAGRPEFGRPSTFDDHVDESTWVSFTATLHDPTFFTRVAEATGNVPGEGGLITFADSNWLASIVLPHQPHFIGQPKGVDVFWGYGLHMNRPGNFVAKPMPACTGREIFSEILGHLNIRADAAKILSTSTVVPSLMPFITSQFLRRAKGDRPAVVPPGTENLAFIGQFCEQPDDVVFTVEYSIRSAMTAVYALLGLKRKAPDVYKGQFEPRVLLEAYRALHDLHA